MKSCLILILFNACAAFAQPVPDSFFYDPKTSTIYRQSGQTGMMSIHAEGLNKPLMVSRSELAVQVRPLLYATVKSPYGEDVVVKSINVDPYGKVSVYYQGPSNSKPIEASLDRIKPIADKPIPRDGIVKRLAAVGLGAEEDPASKSAKVAINEPWRDEVLAPRQAPERLLYSGAEDVAANRAVGKGLAQGVLEKIAAALGGRSKYLIPGVGTTLAAADGFRAGIGLGPAAAADNVSTYCSTQEGVQKLLYLPRESSGAKRPQFASDNLEMTYEQVLESPGCKKKLEELADDMLKYKADSSKCSDSGAATFQMSRVDDGIDRIEGVAKYDEKGSIEKLTIKNLFTGLRTEFIMKNGAVVETIEPKAPEKRFDSITAQKARARTSEEIKKVAQSFLIAEDSYLKECPKLLAQRQKRRHDEMNIVVADASVHLPVTADGTK